MPATQDKGDSPGQRGATIAHFKRWAYITPVPWKYVLVGWLSIFPPILWPDIRRRQDLLKEVRIEGQLLKRRLYICRSWPLLRFEIASESRQEALRKIYARDPLPRHAHFEFWPIGLAVAARNARVRRLSWLNIPTEGIEKLFNYYSEEWSNAIVALALLAGVDMAALTIPGIETAHWTARAFWLSSASMAISGVCLAQLMPGNFSLYFGEDRDQDVPPNHTPLTLSSSPTLLYRVDTLMPCPKEALLHAAWLFLAAVIAFCATVEFGSDARSSSRLPFALVSCVPAGIFWFWKGTPLLVDQIPSCPPEEEDKVDDKDDHDSESLPGPAPSLDLPTSQCDVRRSNAAFGSGSPESPSIGIGFA